MRDLKDKIQELNEEERTDDVLANLINAKLELNFEIFKEELYWE